MSSSCRSLEAERGGGGAVGEMGCRVRARLRAIACVRIRMGGRVRRLESGLGVMCSGNRDVRLHRNNSS